MKPDHKHKKGFSSSSPVNIIVGLPSYNEVRTIARVTQAVDRGLRRYFRGFSCLIVNLDSDSTDGTREAFLDIRTATPKHVINTGSSPRGKGYNLFALFGLAQKKHARYIATFDTDLKSITSAWPKLLLGPIVKKRADLTVPVYARNKYEAYLTNHFAFPLTYALFGMPVRQPIGGEFAINDKLCSYLISRTRIRATYGYGIDIFMTWHALAGGFNTSNVFLGRKVHKPPFPTIERMSRQVIASALQVARQYDGSLPRPSAAAFPKAAGMDRSRHFPARAQSGILLEKASKNALRNLPWYREYLPADYPAIVSLLKSKKKVLGKEMWTDIIAAAIRMAGKISDRRIESVAERLVPLFILRTGSFWDEADRLSSADAEKSICDQARLLRRKLLAK